MIHRFSNFMYKNALDIIDKLLAGKRQKLINNKDFSIICNNCWAGYVYRRFGLPYLTPTVGLYFFSEDFVKLCSDLKRYMSKTLEFISYTESKYRDKLEERKQTGVPIARLGDIEIVFLHYTTEEEAALKWYRRAKRINYDNLIFKFSKINYCTDEHLKQFDEFDFKKKICFVPKNCSLDIKCAVRLNDAERENIENDTLKYFKYVDLVKMINSKNVYGEHMENQ